RDDIVVAVMRKFRAQGVARLRGAGAPDGVRQDDEVFGGVERLPGAEQLVSERRPQPVGARATGAVQKQDAVDDLAGGVASGGSERRVMQLELRDGLAVRKAEVPDDEI